MSEIDIRELARRVEQLEKQMARVADQATARQEEFGSVRANAARIPELQEQVRGLLRDLQRLTGRSTTVEQVPVAEPPRGMPQIDLKKVIEAVLGQLRQTQYLPTKEDVLALVKQEMANAITKIDVQALAERVYRDLSTAGVEEKVAKQLRDQVARDVDVRAVTSAVAEQVLKQLDFKAIAERLVAELSKQLEISVSARRRSL